MDSRIVEKKRAKQNVKKCESSYIRELDSSDDENNQDDISKFNFHLSTILGDMKKNIDEQFVKLEKCFNEAIHTLALTATEPGSASRSAEVRKNLKYEGLCDRYIFQAIAIETSCVFG